MQTLRCGRIPRRGRRGECWLFAVAVFLVTSSTRSLSQQVAPAPGAAPYTVPGPASQPRIRRFLRSRTREVAGPPASALNAARLQHLALAAMPRSASLSAAWSPVGPAQVAHPVYGNVTGRVTAIVIDPAEDSANTVYVGTTGGGVWKSTNAAGPASLVSFVPLTDTLPVFNAGAGSSATASLSIGALAMGNGVLLAGTGDANDATDSYYGSGILRSADGGLTWSLASEAAVGSNGNVSFAGLSVAGLAFSTASPNVVVAAISESVEGTLVEASNPSYSVTGLYVSNDAGQTWQLSTVMDGTQVVQQGSFLGGTYSPATSVVWNPVRQRFYAAIRFHGYYESADGLTWSRLAAQPASGMTLQNCPTLGSSASCPLFRGALAVQPATGDTFAFTVDANNNDAGLFHDVCGATGGSCTSSAPTFDEQVNSAPLEVGSGSTEILQGDYNLVLTAAPSGTDTLLFAGSIDIYRCSLGSGCALRNTTNAQNGCATPAGVAGAQHAIAAHGSLSFFGNDGGLWRSTDGVAETGGVCSASDSAHFDNLNGALGSLAEVVTFAQDPVDPGTLLAGLGAMGSAGTGSASSASAWQQMSTGEGGTVAIDQQNPLNWYVATGPGVNIARCTNGSACGLADFAQTTIGGAQVDSDPSEIDAPWLLDPQDTSQMLVGTCRVWRGPSVGESSWISSDLLSSPFGEPLSTTCNGSPVVRSLAAGGPTNDLGSLPVVGSRVLYAGLAAGSSGISGHLFTTATGNEDSGASPWTDAALSPVTNAASAGFKFNPGAFDISSVTVDTHDASGATVYATVMGFAGNGANAAHLYRSTDGGAHWLNASSNLPNAPANGVAVDPNDANTVYVALDTGVYVTFSITSCPSSSCWSVYGTTLPNAPVLSLSAAPKLATGDGRSGELRAGTYGRGIWQIPLLTATSPAVPAISLNLQSLDFPTQQAGTESLPQSLTVTNIGNAAAFVTSIVASAGFAETDTCLAAALPPLATCSVAVRFAPIAAGTVTGLLTIYANVIGGQATASLTGIATVPAAVVLTPLSVDFPQTTLGTTSSAQNITVSNTGGTVANLQSIASTGDFMISANSCGNSLSPSSGCTISITFKPSASGLRSGTLTVADDAGNQVAQLTGSGTSPATDELSPAALTFAPQQLSTASAAQLVTLTNSGDQPLTLVAASTNGDFSVVNGCGASLQGHASCSFVITYVPKVVGAEVGVLTVSDEFRSQTVALNGTGLAPPGISLSPAAGLSFTPTAVGQMSSTQSITLSNTGGVSLAISAEAVTGDFAVSANTCGNTLAAAASCTVQISFSPTAPGARSGVLSITDNAANSPQTLPLSGVGVDFALAPDGPTSLSVTSGQTATWLLLLTSSAGVPGNASFTCSGVPAAAFCSVNPAAPPLYAPTGTVITVTVSTGQAHALLLLPAQTGSQVPVVCFGLLASAGLIMRRKRRTLTFALAGLLTLAGGCNSVGRTIPGDGGGGVPPPGTPSGTYTLQVAASSGGLTRTVGLTLVVQ